eukprot:GHVP01062491.1.p1 GENE.GHVP01062491.1~~GHVP01062491.1.p1  ORF type:complete len:159 (+),score=29.84 GHVP01062491.1:107-583(+)
MAALDEKQYLTLNTELQSKSIFAPKSDSQKIPTEEAKEAPLMYVWKIWEQIAMQAHQPGRDYSENTQEIATITSVQDFWRVWTALPQPSHLLMKRKMVRVVNNNQHQQVDALMVFREGIKPEWEDPMNSKGGHFEFRINGRDENVPLEQKQHFHLRNY